MSNRLLLVDGHAYAYRAFHAIRSLNAPDGSPTNAVFGFVKMLQKMEATLKPTHRLVLWDGGLAGERLAALPGYKADRPPTPDNLVTQFPRMEAWLDAAGWAQLQQDGTEADDWIGTYAKRASAAGWSTVIASSDKDFLQLVDACVGILNPNDKTERIWGAADVETKTGVLPGQVVDWLALVGDAVDNIPGVPGVGPKTAADLLKRYGSIEALLPRAAEIKADKLRSELMGAGELLLRNQAMVRLKCGMEGGPALGDLAPRAADTARLRELYRTFGFRTLHAELGGDADPGAGPVQGNLF